jgi:2-keto-3-deoxy-6-phosphogluconate aldolase
VTAPRGRGPAGLAHPPWCQLELCSLEALGAGGFHQLEIPVVDDAGRRVASVFVKEHASGRVTIGAGSWLNRSWPPRDAELVARAILEAKQVLDAAERVA